MDSKQTTISRLSQNLLNVVGIVLIWRGLWYYVLDAVDERLFGGNPIFTVVGGILLGLLILYLPDKDLKELDRL